jgi:uncharacterized protein YjdB
MNLLKNNRGNVAVIVPVLLVVLLTVLTSVLEYSRLMSVAASTRDAVSSAMTQICTDNAQQVYPGVREGYSGGYKLEDASWAQNVTTSDILSKVDAKLGTSGGVKTSDGKLVFQISNLSMSMENAPLAPTGTDEQQLTGTATYTLTVPLSFGWSALPPMTIHMEAKSGFSPQGEAAFGGSGDASGPEIDNLSLSESDMTLDKGDTGVLAASIIPDDAEDRKVSWTSTDTGVCAVTQTGAVTGVGVGSASVVALTDNGKMAQCNVTVVSPVAGVSLDKSNIKMIKGATETLTATVRPADATNKGVQWATSDSSVCTVDQSGDISAIGAGAATITVMTQEGGYFAECAVTVTIPVSGITLDKTSMTVAKGATDTLTATVWPGDATRHDVLWASSNNAVCTVDSAGHISAVGVGAAVISATTEDGQYTATCNINVVIPVTGITVSPTSLTLIRYTSRQLTATVSPADATDKTVYWTSSDPTICTVDSTGKVTGVGVGTATVTAKTRDGGYTAAASITVKPNTYVVTVNSSYGGTAYGGGTWNAGSDVTLSEVPYDHYHFTGWSINGITVGTGSSYTIYNLSANVTVTANFAIDTFTINVSGSTGGTASGGGTYPYNTAITLKATANSGYHFIGWSDGALDNPRSYTVTGNATITATFAQDGITYSFSSTSSSSINAWGGDSTTGLYFAWEEGSHRETNFVTLTFDQSIAWSTMEMTVIQKDYVSFQGHIYSNDFASPAYGWGNDLLKSPFFTPNAQTCNIYGQTLHSITFVAENVYGYGYVYFAITMTDVNGHKYHINDSGYAVPE